MARWISRAILPTALKRIESNGSTITDVSPAASGRDYGVNMAGFSIRAYDNDRQKVLVCGRGNGASGDTDDDYVGVWVSSDAGSSWTKLSSPANSTDEYHAAFGGDDSDVIYIWGPPEYFGYSENMGSSIDDRSGDLGDYSPAAFVGIAGGPITA